MTRKQASERFEIPTEVLDVLERISVIEPSGTGASRRYGRADLQVLAAVARFRESGYEESLGFTAYDALIYRRHLKDMAREEVAVMMDRLVSKLSAEEAATIIENGIEPLRELVSAMHAKLIIAELQRYRSGASKPKRKKT